MKRSRGPLYATLGVLAFLYLPLVILAAQSFNASRYGGPWHGFTLKWYARLLHDRDLWHALRNTLLVGSGATAVSVVLGTLAALALHWYRSRLQVLHYALIYTPLVIPDILMGISLLLFFVALGVDLGLGTILLAHITFSVSYVAMVVLGRLQNFDDSLIEAAMDLGADRWTATRLVLLPLLAPGIGAGALLAFTLSIDDFVITFFVSGTASTTLPVYIYSMMRHGSPTIVNALSVLLLVVTFALVFMSQRLLQRREPANR